MRFEGKVAIVTGSSTGIGEAIALALGQEGCCVVLAARSLEKLRSHAEKINGLGGKALPLKTDISRLSDVEEMVKKTVQEFGRIDILVNNAAYTEISLKPFHETKPQDWDGEINTTLRGTLNCCWAVLPQMMKQDYGRIVNITTAGVKTGSQYLSLYGASKAAVAQFTKSLAMEPRLPISLLHEVTTCLGKWLTCNMGLNVFPTTQTVRAIAARFWGSEVAADFSTYEGKALAAKKIQDRSYVKECLVLCDWLWPVMEMEFSEDHVGDPTLESQIVSAVTGREMDEEGLNRIGERVFNLQRAILSREGHKGRASDTIPEQAYTEPLEYEIQDPQLIMPGKDGDVVCLKGRVVDREAFERMKDEYYLLRRWDVPTGLQTRAQLAEVGLEDVAQDLGARGLLAPTARGG